MQSQTRRCLGLGIRCVVFVLLCVSHIFPQLGSRSTEAYVKVLESPERVEKLKIPEVIEILELTPGTTLADIGAGSGIFSRPLAKAVGPHGTVFAVDVEQGLLNYVDKRSREANITNIKTVLGEFGDPKIPEKVDLMLICDTLHHIEERAKYLKVLPKYLKPGGRVAVIDFRQNWPTGHESMVFTTQQLTAWMSAAGFEATGEYSLIQDAFFVIYSIK